MTTSKKSGNGAKPGVMSAARGSSEWNASLGRLRAALTSAHIETSDEHERVSVVVNQPARSLRPPQSSRGKTAGVLVGVVLGLTAVLELVIRLAPELLKLLQR